MLLVPVNCLELMSIVQTRFPDSSLGIADGIYLGSRNELCFILFGREGKLLFVDKLYDVTGCETCNDLGHNCL